jgi:hypothetical protein
MVRRSFTGRSRCAVLLGSVALGGCAAFAAVDAVAEGSVRRGGQETFFGIVHVAPNNGVGLWQIGSRRLESDTFTQFDVLGMQTWVGQCATVNLIGSRVIRITIREASAC